MQNETEKKQIKRARLKMLSIVAIFAAPMLAAWLAFNYWKPSRLTNYGALLEAHAVPAVSIRTADGSTHPLSDLKGKWVMLVAASGNCDATCQRQLYIMRQVRAMQGKDADRLARVWLLTDAAKPTAALMQMHAGTVIGVDQTGQLTKALGAAGPIANRLYIIDPLGNLIMRYPVPTDPVLLSKDIKRLLAASFVG